MLTSIEPSDTLGRLIAERAATVGVIGLGYVGLPLAAAVARAGFSTIGFDIDAGKVSDINAATSYIYAVSDALLSELVQRGTLRATQDFGELASCDVIIICVPTPLTKHREPDLSFVENTALTIARHLRKGQLVVLESTTYPGTTSEVLKPILERGGLKSGSDFFLGFSPEREDPGNASFETVSIPKIVAGDGGAAKELMARFYGAVVKRVVPVSSTEVAEAVKITENVFRAVNIALVNELKVIYDAMGIDVWEVIDAAATKPFGYMPFYPGPGLGGHCIPIDPFYLTWKSREHELTTRFIELAGEINLSMPRYVVGKLEAALDRRFSRSLGSARILILGLAYKKNVADIRESPSLKLIELIERRGAKVDFHDPHVAAIPATRAYPEIEGRQSVDLTPTALASYDAVIVVTDHDAVDYALVAAHARLLIDTRNVFQRKGIAGDHIVKS
ncbi:MAG TPA: nucleotide sugar dehydrogenase [Hyphomicrobiaceae bacterium]|nr:nucleotide sugar dehydrogenase [Hyphomicrobiaceae bacterium]